MIKVKFYTTLRLLLKKKEITIDADKISIESLLNTVQDKITKKFLHKLLDNDGSVKSNTMILVNGKNVHHLQGKDTIVHKNDVVALFPPGGGG